MCSVSFAGAPRELSPLRCATGSLQHGGRGQRRPQGKEDVAGLAFGVATVHSPHGPICYLERLSIKTIFGKQGFKILNPPLQMTHV